MKQQFTTQNYCTYQNTAKIKINVVYKDAKDLCYRIKICLICKCFCDSCIDKTGRHALSDVNCGRVTV